MVRTNPAISIKLLGGVSVYAGDVLLPLPASRKTRALLGYLLLAQTPQSRRQICDLIWEAPDDPRGALRWSLSMLRPIMNFDQKERLVASRSQVAICLDDVDVDVHRIRASLEEGGTPEAVSRSWHATTEMLLIDCQFANQPAFEAWLALERQKVANLRLSLARRMTFCNEVAPDEAVVWAERWLDARPFDVEAARAVVACRREAGRVEEAAMRAADLDIAFQKAGLEAPSFARSVPGADRLPEVTEEVPDKSTQRTRQATLFARTSDNVNVAWASIGAADAPPLVRVASWLTHLELDWDGPIWSRIYRELAAGRRFVRYDGRGCGLSDRDVPTIDLNSFVADLEAVVDCAGVDRFPLLGISQGVAVAVEYAARHPERVSHLILYGGSPAGWRFLAHPEEVRKRDAVTVLAEVEWGQISASSRHLFSATLVPGATPQELAQFDELRRMSTSSHNAARFSQAYLDLDVRHRLASLEIPTLVIHSRDDPRVPVWAGRALASAIPRAQFILLESENHMLLGREPAANVFIAAVRQFLASIH